MTQTEFSRARTQPAPDLTKRSPALAAYWRRVLLPTIINTADDGELAVALHKQVIAWEGYEGGDPAHARDVIDLLNGTLDILRSHIRARIAAAKLALLACAA